MSPLLSVYIQTEGHLVEIPFNAFYRVYRMEGMGVVSMLV